ncbi:MAG: retroviral-like aspartic protease [Segetibacter sp.]|nr:retroviral-like aspartic protease [Segetibacter sp.]
MRNEFVTLLKELLRLIYAEIELINGGDLEVVRRGYLDKDEVKRMWVTALVDTGSYMLAINENIQEQLQLPVVEKRKAQLANGESYNVML